MFLLRIPELAIVLLFSIHFNHWQYTGSPKCTWGCLLPTLLALNIGVYDWWILWRCHVYELLLDADYSCPENMPVSIKKQNVCSLKNMCPRTGHANTFFKGCRTVLKWYRKIQLLHRQGSLKCTILSLSSDLHSGAEGGGNVPITWMPTTVKQEEQ